MARARRWPRAGHAEGAAPSPPTVLVVEDEASTRELLQIALEAEGYRVETASDGPSAVARVQAGGVALVLLDVLLPQLNGLAVCRQIRAAPGGEQVPVVLLTALASPAQRRAGFAAGATDYVVKPFDTDDLLDRVRRWAPSA